MCCFEFDIDMTTETNDPAVSKAIRFSAAQSPSSDDNRRIITSVNSHWNRAGPNNQRFREARQLLVEGGGFEIHDAAEFNATMDRLLTDEVLLAQSGERAGHYVKENAGAADAILKAIAF